MFDLIVDFLPAKIRPKAKAIAALFTPLALYVAHSLIVGSWDLDTLDVLVGTAITGGVVHQTPNRDDSLDGTDKLP